MVINRWTQWGLVDHCTRWSDLVEAKLINRQIVTKLPNLGYFGYREDWWAYNSADSESIQVVIDVLERGLKAL